MDKLTVRILAILTNIWLLYSILLAWLGEVASVSVDIFGDSLAEAILLSVLCFSQGKYHCIWMQCLCCNLLITSLINISSTIFPIEFDVLPFLIIISTTWFISTSFAFYFAISHFIKVKRLKKFLNGEKE